MHTVCNNFGANDVLMGTNEEIRDLRNIAAVK